MKKQTEKLDENYLVKLENEQKNVQAKADAKKILIAADQKRTTQVDTDRVNVAQSSVAKMPIPTPKASFSVTSYIGKFVAFLSLMILGFYGVLTLFKKGVIKKGKLRISSLY